MRLHKALVGVLLGAVLIIGCSSVAGAWTCGIDTYTYIGKPPLAGTVPGAVYTTKVAVIHNESATREELVVDLYYGHLSGKYEYSPNEGTNWMVIDDTVETWVKTVPAGGTIWLRAELYTASGTRYHILSPSPWGAADTNYGEEYYFAFPPTARYWARGWVRDIVGFVAVVRQ